MSQGKARRGGIWTDQKQEGQQPSLHCTSTLAFSGRSSSRGLSSARVRAGTAHNQLYSASTIVKPRARLARKQNHSIAVSLHCRTAKARWHGEGGKKNQDKTTKGENSQQKGKEISTENREMEMKQSVCLLQGPKRCHRAFGLV